MHPCAYKSNTRRLMKSLTAVDTLYTAPEDGKDGRIPYPAGTYASGARYSRTSTATPYVEKAGNYYILNVDSAQGIDPVTDVANNGKHWLLMDKFAAIFVEMLIANLGKLGSAVFYGDYMYSQYGKRGTTVIDTAGNYSAPTDAGGDFSPNFIIDFLTGKLRCANAEVKGKVEADEGYIGNMTISGSQFDSKNGKIFFGGNSNSYTYIYTDKDLRAANSTVAIDNADGGYGLYVHASATNKAALWAVGAKAIQADGNVVVTGDVVATRLHETSFASISPSAGSVTILSSSTAGNIHKLHLKFTADNATIGLPSKETINALLGQSSGTSFCFDIDIVCSVSSTTTGYIRGRNTEISSMNSASYPYLAFADGSTSSNKYAIGKGDCIRITLVYDGTGYYAYLSNIQN